MMAGMTITHVQVLSVPVADQDRARDFYVNTLGFDLVAENPMGPDQRWIQVAPKGATTGLTLVTWFDTMPPGSLKGLVLQTPDIDGEAARLRTAGVDITDPEDAPWGRFATFHDPDGNGIVLSGPIGA
jgi:catechol 2,3-dioxygenase-like lactoylglutathione lyase family enzyme